MIDNNLLAGVKARMPKINDEVANGLAVVQLDGIEEEVHHSLESINADLPDNFKYVGYKVVDPITEFNEATRPRDGSTRKVELARSDFYMVRFEFQITNRNTGEIKTFYRYLYLPFAEAGGMLYIRGKRHTIHPVLADPVISLGETEVYIPLNKKRLTFERTHHHFTMNRQSETVYVVWCWVHAKAKPKSQSKRITYTVIPHYLFAKYGVTQAFSLFAGADVVIGDASSINEDAYPSEDWTICSSFGVQPISYKGTNYSQCKLRVAVPNKQMTPLVKSLLGGLFYVADHFPTRVTPEDVDSTHLWKTLLGIIINGTGASEGLLVNEINEHLVSLDEYVDYVDKMEFKQAGFAGLDNIYEVFIYAISYLSGHQSFKHHNISSIYGKRLMTRKYILFNVTYNINRMMYDLRAAQRKKGAIDENDLSNALNKWFKTTEVFKITAGHGEVTTVSTSCDNLIIGVTNKMVPQEDATSKSGGGKHRVTLNKQNRKVHVSLAEAGGYNVLPKHAPTGHSTVSPFVDISPIGVIEQKEKFIPLLSAAQRRLNTPQS